MVAHTPDSVGLEAEEKISVPGFEEHEIAHLSNGQRRKLADERNAGKRAHTGFANALAYNERQVREAQAREEAKTGGVPMLDPSEITARRIAEHRMAEERARSQQAINAAANAAKEAADQNEVLHGREVTLDIKGAEPVAEVAKERVEQAEGAGLGPDQATHGHPLNSQQQAEAVMVNTMKEVQDRSEAGENGAMQGYGEANVQVSRSPQFDSRGSYMGMMVNGVFEPDPEYDGGETPVIPEDVAQNRTDPNVGVVDTEHQPPANPPPSFPVRDNPVGPGPEQVEHPESPAENGQSQQTSEPDAATLAAGLGTDEDTSGKKRGGKKSGKPASTNASPIGTGPVSE